MPFTVVYRVPFFLINPKPVAGSANGKLAKSGKKVLVHYTGRLKSNGKVFDKSSGKPFAFRLGEYSSIAAVRSQYSRSSQHPQQRYGAILLTSLLSIPARDTDAPRPFCPLTCPRPPLSSRCTLPLPCPSPGVGEVIKGWDLGVEGMRVGDKRHLVIPAQLAYGSSGVKGTIPPNAVLEFDVQLVDVK